MNAKSFNQPACKVYIVTESACAMVGAEDLKVINVQPQQEAAFLEAYAGRIIAAGNSIQEVLIKFSLLANGK